MRFPLTISFFALVVAAMHCFASVMSASDRQTWNVTKKAYRKGEFLSYRTSLYSFANVPSLEHHAWVHALATGVIPIAKHGLAPAAETEPARLPSSYFSSVIKPGHQLHNQMVLHQDMDAYAFWKKEGSQSHLVQIDTLNHLDKQKWFLQPLREVLHLS
ncbi:uncharacterized protein UBRO_03665 [Ustilago bromivora]|uniref:Uncharacterized protein n=1 Tax=Ustilago bromivora TaxID=307758 RepID=A0A1K0G6I8_9BASI|nr:uncharacterized protein UBRO_03665 [Ustilago bromivora]